VPEVPAASASVCYGFARQCSSRAFCLSLLHSPRYRSYSHEPTSIVLRTTSTSAAADAAGSCPPLLPQACARRLRNNAVLKPRHVSAGTPHPSAPAAASRCRHPPHAPQFDPTAAAVSTAKEWSGSQSLSCQASTSGTSSGVSMSASSPCSIFRSQICVNYSRVTCHLPYNYLGHQQQ